MGEPTVIVTREQLRRAAVVAWTDCIPRYHMDFDRFWQLLVDGIEIPDTATTSERSAAYSVMSYEAWVDGDVEDDGTVEPWQPEGFEPPQL